VEEVGTKRPHEILLTVTTNKRLILRSIFTLNDPPRSKAKHNIVVKDSIKNSIV